MLKGCGGARTTAPKRSSMNAGAPWIKRTTATNFPGVPQIVDWSHVAQHLWVAVNALHGEQTPLATRWVEQGVYRFRLTIHVVLAPCESRAPA